MAHPNFEHIWRDIIEKRPNQPLFKIPSPEASEYLFFKASTFFNRASRVHAALKFHLKLKEGDRIALLSEDPQDIALVLHGAWLARLVVIPLDLSLGDDFIVSILNNANVKVALFPSAFSARVVTLVARAFSVEHWIVTGKGAQTGQGSPLKRLEEIVNQAAGVRFDFKETSDRDSLGLIALTSGYGKGVRGVGLTQSQILHSATVAAPIFPNNDQEEHVAWSLLPRKSLNGLMASFVMPLITAVPAVHNFEYEIRRFWEHVMADGITWAAVSQGDLRSIIKAGKSKTWRQPPNLQLALITNSPYSSELLATFEKRFGVPVTPTYSQTELGGIVTAFPRERAQEYITKWLYDFEVPSSGVQLAGVEIVIADLEGNPVEDEAVGEILVRTPQAMKGYLGTTPGECYFGQKAFLHTGDEGFLVADDSGKKHLFVTGRAGDVIVRNNERISPAKIDNVLREIRGVEFAMAVGFPNLHTGFEIGAYVVPVKLANLSEEEILASLRQSLEWTECPKVVVFGEFKRGSQPPKRVELQALFKQHFERDYSHGR